MLPNAIINHPFFHADVEEAKAKEILKKHAMLGNLIFCSSKNNSKFNPIFLLCYRASFHGQQEIHTLILNYNEKLKIISHNSLGDAKMLYEIANKLVEFMDMHNLLSSKRKIELLLPCLGKKADDGGNYSMGYTELMPNQKKVSLSANKRNY